MRPVATAKTVDGLQVFGRCACGDSGCGTFYARPCEEWLGRPLRLVIPEVPGLYAIDVCAEAIVCVEFLDRADVEAFLDEAVGPAGSA